MKTLKWHPRLAGIISIFILLLTVANLFTQRVALAQISDSPTVDTNSKRPERTKNFVVTNTSDSGYGSLRKAILDANSSPQLWQSGCHLLQYCRGRAPHDCSCVSLATNHRVRDFGRHKPTRRHMRQLAAHPEDRARRQCGRAG